MDTIKILLAVIVAINILGNTAIIHILRSNKSDFVKVETIQLISELIWGISLIIISGITIWKSI